MPKKRNAGAGARQRAARLGGLLGLVALGVLLLAGGLWLMKDTLGTPAGAVSPPLAQEQPTAVTTGVTQPATPIAAVTATPEEPTPVPATPTAGEALASADEVQRIDPAQAKALMDSGQAVMYDTRGAEFYQSQHAAGALSLPYDQVESLAGTLPKGKIIILYCT